MYSIRETTYFSHWLTKLKDVRGKVSIIRRLKRLRNGNFGDYKSVGNQLYELRITMGPGYRIYYIQQETEMIILLVGGDKSSQTRDIEKAKRIAKEYQDE